MSTPEFIYLYEVELPEMEGRYHHPASGGTIGRKAAEMIWGSKCVFVPKDQWTSKDMLATEVPR